MDIKMNDVNFYKNGNWIYLKVDGGDDIKVFYDDGRYKLDKPVAEYYSDYLKVISNTNAIQM